ncbi:MAG: DNA-directed RNA polymerase subunit beta [Oscillospiraceae bacterium]|nr:DNA-directed RNA polymerase subunit beta [Oscillospiraceae bacterium]
MVKPQKLGNNIRMSFAKIKEALEMPNLIEVQKNSYRWFLDEGLMEVLRDVSPIVDYSGNLTIEFTGYFLDPAPKYPVEECKDRDVNYAAPLKITVRLENKNSGEVKQSEIYMGDFPLMTENGSFIINGAERVVVSQIVRSPGIYYEAVMDKSGKRLFSNTVIPYRGAWLEYETDLNDVFYVRIDKNRKIPITVLIRALGINSSDEIKEIFGDGEKILATLEKDATPGEAEINNTTASDEALKEIYRKLRPGDPPLVESAKVLINNLFFDPKRYDLSTVGRYKFNKKLALAYRIAGFTLSRPAVSPITGEILAEAGEKLTRKTAEAIEDNGINEVYINIDDDREVKVFSNDMIYLDKVVNFDISGLGIKEKVKFSVLQDILKNYSDETDIKDEIKRQKDKLVPKHIIKADIFSSINYLICLGYGIGETDDIDHLGNRRLRSVGELLQNQMRMGFARMDKVIKERMTTQDPTQITPQSLINIRPLVSSIKEFFGSNPLSQFMDQTNPVSEITHKRRLSALGHGGLSRERASFEVRDVHYTHYGRMCPIETPEGPNIGLISYLATYAKINQYGFIQAPYRKINKETGEITDEIVYMTADQEDEFYVVQANEPLTDDHKYFKNYKVAARHRNEITEVEKEQADFIDVSPKMLVSVATALIPFLENDDNSRALMGSNMQKQAVPLMISESPIIGTGMEYKIAMDSGAAVVSRDGGIVESVSADEIIVRNNQGHKDVYHLIKFKRSNQGTCINQRPIVSKDQQIEKGEVIADGPSTDNGEISLGKNVLIGFMTWEGYNYEDAVLINERLVRDDVYTSIHIEEYSHESKDTKLGPEEITKDIPNVGDDALKNLTSEGIVRKGAEVRAGDILVGKVTPKGETELTAEERLLRAIFGEKAREVRDTSLKLPHGESGIVVDVKVFSRENSDELTPGVNKVARVYVAQKRKISVGDKMAGRHGNKGVISRILPPEDMPFLPDGTPLDIVLNPLGVPSRMNIGQVLEVHLGIAAKYLGWKIMTPVFDGANERDIEDCLIQSGLDPDGKSVLYDGRTGMPFDNRVTVGYMYFLKLLHLVDDKIHARSTGPYSLVTQQPLGGKAQFGGQRFGEMEVWALEAYGAAYTLQEILTVKSDDTLGRVKTYEAIVKGQNIPTPGVPESFKVLIKELQSLGLDIRVLDKEMREVHIKESSEEDVNRPKSITPEMIGESVIERDSLEDGGYTDDGYKNDEDEEDSEYEDDEDAKYEEVYDGDEDENDYDDYEIK